MVTSTRKDERQAALQPKDATGKPVDPRLLEGARDINAQEAAPARGDNKPSLERTLLAEMTEHHVPRFINLGSAEMATIAAMVKMNQAANTMDGNRKVELSIAMADLAFHAAKDGKIVLNANADAALKRYIRGLNERDPEFVGVTISKTLGDAELEQTARAGILDGVASATMTSATHCSLLYAISHKSGVVFGTLPHKERRTRFNEGDIWEPLGERTLYEVSRSHYVALCVPENVIWPFVYKVNRVNGRDVLIPEGENTRTNLVYLRDEWARLLFLHHYADKKFALWLSEGQPNAPKGKPKGSIIAVEGETRGRAPASNQGKTPEGRIADAISRATAGDTATDTLAGKVFSCAAAMVALPQNEWKCTPQDAIRAGLFAGRAAIAALIRDRKSPSAAHANDPLIRPELIALIDELSSLLAQEEDGDDYIWSPDPDTELRLKNDLAPLPLGVNPITAQLAKTAAKEAAPAPADKEADKEEAKEPEDATA